MSLIALRDLLAGCIPHDHCRQTGSQQMLRDHVSAGSEPADVLDFGCGDGRSIDLFKALLPATKWVGVDIESSPEVDTRKRSDGVFFTYDGRTLPFSSGSFDMVYSTQVIEHVRYP